MIFSKALKNTFDHHYQLIEPIIRVRHTHTYTQTIFTNVLSPADVTLLKHESQKSYIHTEINKLKWAHKCVHRFNIVFSKECLNEKSIFVKEKRKILMWFLFSLPFYVFFSFKPNENIFVFFSVNRYVLIQNSISVGNWHEIVVDWSMAL